MQAIFRNNLRFFYVKQKSHHYGDFLEKGFDETNKYEANKKTSNQ